MNYGFMKNKLIINLLLINLIVFCINWLLIFFNINPEWFSVMPISYSELFTKPWTFFTAIFSHISVWHLISNAFYLYAFGRLAQQYLGKDNLLTLYVIGGLFASLMTLIILNTEIFSISESAMLGASGAVFAIAVGVTRYMPNYYLNVFLLGPIKLKWITLILFVLATVFQLNSNFGGALAHFFGGVFGWFYISHVNQNDPFKWFKDLCWNYGILIHAASSISAYRRGRIETQELKVIEQRKNREREKLQQSLTLDKILDKISASGYESLSLQEKDFLKKYS